MNQSGLEQAHPVGRASLPTAAQRWLDRALPQAFDLPSRVEIEQEGSMEIRGAWTPFTARGTYQAAPLAFGWRARLRIATGAWIVADDGHRAGRGWGRARLWGVIPLGTRTDPEVLQTQLVRNLAELAWLPSFVLADPALAWWDLGKGACEVRTSAGGQEAVVRFEIDDGGDVVRAYSPSRSYDVAGGYEEAPWYYEFGEHRAFNGVRMPAAAVATFEKREGNWEYFRARLTSVTPGQGDR